MATFRIALVLVCLMAVGATKTCPDGADSETCSQLDASSLIQLPATATVSQANVAAEHLGASGGLAHVDTTTTSAITCSTCMALLRSCIASESGGGDPPLMGANPAAMPAPDVCSDAAGGVSTDYPCKCGLTTDAMEECSSGQGCTASSDFDGVCVDPCDAFNTALMDPDKGRNYQSVLCILGHSECGATGDVLNGPADCLVQAGALQFPGFESLCPNPSDESDDDLLPLLTQQQATRKLKRDAKGDVSRRACINPNKDDPASWACPCLDDMRAECTDATQEQACFKALMCGDVRISDAWKYSNCDGVFEDADECPGTLLVETNTSMEARVKEGTPSQALDDSLSGKRCA